MTYEKKERHAARFDYAYRGALKKTSEEKAFRKMFGSYPASENELKQIRSYLKFKKKTTKLDLMFKNL